MRLDPGEQEANRGGVGEGPELRECGELGNQAHLDGEAAREGRARAELEAQPDLRHRRLRPVAAAQAEPEKAAGANHAARRDAVPGVPEGLLEPRLHVFVQLHDPLRPHQQRQLVPGEFVRLAAGLAVEPEAHRVSEGFGGGDFATSRGHRE